MGDISRKTFDSRKHYSGVLQQQGRVQVDADWNEQVAIHHHRTETEATDVIGACGAPTHGGGFKVEKTPDGQDLTIAAGRIYVDGLLCELEAAVVPAAFTQNGQPVAGNQAVVPASIVDGRVWHAGQWVEISAANQPPRVLQITAVDGRVLTFAGDITDLETADARLRRITTYLTQPDYPKPDFTSALTSPPSSPPASPPSSPPTSPPSGFEHLALGDGTYVVYLDVWPREINALDDPRIREVALGGPDTATRLKTVWQAKILRVSASVDIRPTCATSFSEWNDLVAPSTGTLNARTTIQDDPKDPCLLPPSAGYRRLENQLYRVEIHTGGARDAAMFKWSRDNATVETRIENIAGNTITVADVGKDDVLGFSSGQWVEVVDDASALGGNPRPLVQIDTVEPATRHITMKTSLGGIEQTPSLKLRRWDQNGTATGVGVPLTADWIDLEGGIQVRFAEGKYRAGDYWVIPARTATGDIEWPPFDVPNLEPIPQPPAGIRHHYCRLALADVVNGELTLRDCRLLFPPLTELTPSRDREPGVHIVGVELSGKPLTNDLTVLPLALAGGIRVTCDEKIEQLSVGNTDISKPTCFLTLDLPFPLNDIDRGLWGDHLLGFQPMILAARVRADGQNILWEPLTATQAWLPRLLARINELKLADRVLAHLTLKGNFIWAAADAARYLDGDVFGFLQPSGNATEIRLPSGDARRGGDFEMWFWVITAPPLLKINAVRILRTGPDPNTATPEVLGTLNVVPTTLPIISVPPSAQPNAIEVQFTAPPDPSSLSNGKTVIVRASNNTVLDGQILVMPDGTTIRWALPAGAAAGLAPDRYRITLKGETPAITSQGVALDGEPSGTPSGNNVPGGDFNFILSVG